MGTIISIQYLRGIAALLVVALHIFSELKESDIGFSIGNFGVDIFFVVSGFIMWAITRDGGITTTEFWWHRLARIAPIYWILTLVSAVVSIDPEIVLFGDFDIAKTLMSILFIPHFSTKNPEWVTPILTQGWTLNFEIFFYFVFGLFLLLPGKFRFVSLLVTFGALATVGIFLRPENPVFSVYTNSLLLEFLMGIILGAMFLTNKIPAAPIGALCIIISIILLYFGVLSTGHRGIDRGVPAVFFVLGFISMEGFFQKNKVDFLCALGNSSYSLYLTHTFSIAIILFLWRRSGDLLQNQAILFFLVNIVFSCAVGHLVFRTIEFPMYKKLRLIVSNLKKQ